MQHDAIMTDDEWHQQRYLQHRHAALEEGVTDSNQLITAAVYPSMGAINQVHGAEGYNIFQNLSGTASGLASQQLSAQRAPASRPHQRSAELERAHSDVNDAAQLDYDQDYASQIPHKERGSQSAAQLTRSGARSGSSQKKDYPVGSGPRGDTSPHQLTNSQSQYFQRGFGQSGDKDTDSLQSPPKEQASAPLVMKIDDLLRESGRTGFNLPPGEQTSNFEMNKSPYKENYR